MPYYWDRWEQRALAAGVSAELAQLGREVMRDHFQHGKEDHQLGEESDGDYMLDMCMRDPDAAKTRFQEDLCPWLEQEEGDDGGKIRLSR